MGRALGPYAVPSVLGGFLYVVNDQKPGIRPDLLEDVVDIVGRLDQATAPKAFANRRHT